MDEKVKTFIAWLTLIVVVGYVGASIYAFAATLSSWEQFSGAIGPLAGMLLGYWIRGAQNE